jgi:hypothetical protein
MKVIHALIIALAVALTLSTVASANVHKAVRSATVAAVEVVTGADAGTAGDEASPSPEPSGSVMPSPAPTATEPADGSGEQPANHGAAVSAVAKDKTAVATRVLPNGKTITNHGQAVSAVAKSDAGKQKAQADAQDGQVDTAATSPGATEPSASGGQGQGHQGNGGK